MIIKRKLPIATKMMKNVTLIKKIPIKHKKSCKLTYGLEFALLEENGKFYKIFEFTSSLIDSCLCNRWYETFLTSRFSTLIMKLTRIKFMTFLTYKPWER